MAGFSLGKNVLVKRIIVTFQRGVDYGMVWAISLDKDIGRIKMAAADAADDLGQQVKGALLRRIIG